MISNSQVIIPSGIALGSTLTDTLLLLLPAIPFFGAGVVYLLSRILNKGVGGLQAPHDSGHDSHLRTSSFPGYLATLFSLSSFIVAALVFCSAFGSETGVGAVEAFGWEWIAAGKLSIPFTFRMDHLSGVMCLVITGIGTLIHLYAVGYMAHDPYPARFFAYLNLFLGSMLILVLGDSLPVMFVGWEGVGLCSYLLIGFWYTEMDNAKAGQKAFIVNRIGDAGFLLGIFVLFYFSNTMSVQGILDQVDSFPPYALECAAFLLLIGAAGKSAQIPLFVWLPDAMAGPTPVSALIHAATMVTSGIYMVSRLGAVFAHAPYALLVLSIVATATAFVAATIAIVQNDIKKVLAYSTVSQLGYMFMALGAGAFSVGMFHVVTHAFFKALLFMCAGSVIVGCHHEQDMRKFGGLIKYMSITAITYIAGTYAIAGLPYGSGFFSKDSVLWAVYSNPGLPSQITVIGGFQLSQVLWGIGVLTAALTAFYMTRSMMLTFFGSYRGTHTPHESPWNMTLPLIALAIPSLGFGYLYGDTLLHFLDAWTRSDFHGGHHHLAQNPTYVALEQISMWVAITSACVAVLFYSVLSKVPGLFAAGLKPAHTFLTNKWYVDELYQFSVIKPLWGISRAIFLLIDRLLIDGLLVSGAASIVSAFGFSLRSFHSGRIQTAVSFMFSLFVFIFIFWMVL